MVAAVILSKASNLSSVYLSRKKEEEIPRFTRNDSGWLP